jgi:hypothetical protein
VKPSKVTSARDLFRRKAQKITHLSSAASASNLTQISNEDQLRDEMDDRSSLEKVSDLFHLAAPCTCLGLMHLLYILGSLLLLGSLILRLAMLTLLDTLIDKFTK